MTESIDESITGLGTIIGAKMAEIARLRKTHDDLLCSVKLSVYFMDQAQTPFEMRMAVAGLKAAIKMAERS